MRNYCTFLNIPILRQRGWKQADQPIYLCFFRCTCFIELMRGQQVFIQTITRICTIHRSRSTLHLPDNSHRTLNHQMLSDDALPPSPDQAGAGILRVLKKFSNDAPIGRPVNSVIPAHLPILGGGAAMVQFAHMEACAVSSMTMTIFMCSKANRWAVSIYLSIYVYVLKYPCYSHAFKNYINLSCAMNAFSSNSSSICFGCRLNAL